MADDKLVAEDKIVPSTMTDAPKTSLETRPVPDGILPRDLVVPYVGPMVGVSVCSLAVLYGLNSVGLALSGLAAPVLGAVAGSYVVRRAFVAKSGRAPTDAERRHLTATLGALSLVWLVLFGVLAVFVAQHTSYTLAYPGPLRWNAEGVAIFYGCFAQGLVVLSLYFGLGGASEPAPLDGPAHA
ncbi:MAG: hypothetical protein AAGB03_08260, partial [Pseudomonadota bacterium]